MNRENYEITSYPSQLSESKMIKPKPFINKIYSFGLLDSEFYEVFQNSNTCGIIQPSYYECREINYFKNNPIKSDYRKIFNSLLTLTDSEKSIKNCKISNGYGLSILNLKGKLNSDIVVPNIDLTLSFGDILNFVKNKIELNGGFLKKSYSEL